MDIGRLTLEELKKGYRYDGEADAYRCNDCDRMFPMGQVFAIGEGFYVPARAAAMHVEAAHGGSLTPLIDSDTRYNTLTDVQKELLRLFHGGMPDGEIAKKLGVSASTVRHQKFTFREKAKQAKLYLAIFENAFETGQSSEEAIIPMHDHATCCDERYVITEREKAHALETFFVSLHPLLLKNLSSKEKNKVVILSRIAEEFEPGRSYAEKEVNEILKRIYDDYATIRRYLIEYGFMDRERDGSRYWRNR